MLHSFLVLSLSVLTTSGVIAQNLVPNPSFEDFSSQFCGIMSPNDFNQSMVNWSTPTGGSPEVYYTNIANTCFNYQPNSQYSGPIGIKGSQLPNTGEAMVGIGVYTIAGLNQREYIQVELSSPLTVGFSYVLEYYVSLADSVEFATDNIEALLSVGAVSASNNNVLNYTPQISYAGGFLSNVSEWMLISDTILAQEAFTHLTIGNFQDDNSTNLQANPSASGGVGTYGAYYYLDDIRIEEIRDLSTIDHDIDQRITLYPNPVNNELVAEFDGDFSSMNFELYNTLGQKLLISPIFSEMGKVKFDLADLENGMYVLKITENQKEKTVKIIVRH